jgi:hypothetical protein
MITTPLDYIVPLWEGMTPQKVVIQFELKDFCWRFFRIPGSDQEWRGGRSRKFGIIPSPILF